MLQIGFNMSMRTVVRMRRACGTASAIAGVFFCYFKTLKIVLIFSELLNPSLVGAGCPSQGNFVLCPLARTGLPFCAWVGLPFWVPPSRRGRPVWKTAGQGRRRALEWDAPSPRGMNLALGARLSAGHDAHTIKTDYLLGR